MGRCTSKNIEESESITLENYIGNIISRKSERRNTIIAYQEIRRLSEQQEPLEKATIVNDIIDRAELMKILSEAGDINAEKIYSDYVRYVDYRRTLALLQDSNLNYIDSIIIQVSLLNKNLKRFPHSLSSKYLITEGIYDESIKFYSLDNSLQFCFIEVLAKALKSGGKWSSPITINETLAIVKKLIHFWLEYLESNPIKTSNEFIEAKGREGEYLLKNLKVSEIDFFVILYEFGFYFFDQRGSAWNTSREKYRETMKKALSYNEDMSTEFCIPGGLGLMNMKQMN